MTILPRWLQSSQYTPLSPDGQDRNVLDKDVDAHLLSPLPPNCKHVRCLSVAALALLLLLTGTAGFVIGFAVSPNRVESNPRLPDTVPQVPTRWVTETFRYNDSFAATPPKEGGPEPIWDSLIPNGLGYIHHPRLAPNLSVISVFHQLHCLYTLRRAYYSTTAGDKLEDFDFGIDRAPHAAHCFEYLRQSLMCSADSTVEPAGRGEGEGEGVRGFLGWGFRRQCRDYGQLKEWAERWRAFEGHGFVAMPPGIH